jgi:hypothetical protein
LALLSAHVSEAAQRVSQRITANNLRTERSAALVDSDAPIAVLQFLRVIRESNFPDRKLFFKQIELVQYLTDLLTFAELARLQAFLAEGPATAVSSQIAGATIHSSSEGCSPYLARYFASHSFFSVFSEDM